MEVVAGDPRDLLRVEPEQLADPVVLVDDVVAEAELGEARERPPQPRVRARRAFAEDLRVRQERDAQVARHEPAARGHDREADPRLGGERLARLEQGSVDLAKQPRLALRLARVGERDDDTVAGADEPRELVLRLAQPPRGDRRPLRLEGVRLRARKRVELCGPVEVDGCDPVLFPDPAQVVGAPDEVGPAIDRGDEVGGHLDTPFVALLRWELWLVEVAPTLRGGVHDRPVLCMSGLQRRLHRDVLETGQRLLNRSCVHRAPP